MQTILSHRGEKVPNDVKHFCAGVTVATQTHTLAVLVFFVTPNLLQWSVFVIIIDV